MSMFTPDGAGGRRQSRHSGTGRRVVAVVVVLLLVAVGGVTAWRYVDKPDNDVASTKRPVCPAPSPAAAVIPAAQVKVNVYNSTDRQGLAGRVADELERRGFRVAKVDNDPAKRKVTGPAEVRHSRPGAAAARTVIAQVGQAGRADKVVSVPDQRDDASVDLVLGAAFTRLLPPDEASAALSPAPSPVPAGC